ncbi:Ig domain-containing protein [Bryobacter aggregatus]|uniref:Ig domain-containing protein n=1 Tax=Bryobacter aggregatus TaxID=360054 RepID=UPI0004E24DE2|nr:Ig domain-containing protein [Bryobacter aggregatus]
MRIIQKVVLASLFVVAAAFGQITIQPYTFPDGTQSTSYGPVTLVATGAMNYAWFISEGALPSGLGIDPSTGVVSGFLDSGAMPGVYPFTVRAVDSSSIAYGERNFSIRVVAPPTLTATQSSLPNAVANTPYSVTLASYFTVNGGVAPYKFQYEYSPVSGLNLNSAGTILSGAAHVAPNTYVFSLYVRDANHAISNVANINLTVTSLPLQISTSTLPNWTVNQPYFGVIQSANGIGAYRYSATGSLPPGVVNIPKANCPLLPTNPVAGRYFQAQASLSGGTGPYRFWITNADPPLQLTMNSAGTLSGAAPSAGSYPYTLYAEDATGLQVYRDCALTIVPPYSGFSMSAACPQSYAQLGSHYASGLTLLDAQYPFGIQLLSGSFPAGLSLNSEGLLSGTPTTAGLSTFTMRGTSGSEVVDKTCTIRVFNAPSPVNAGAIFGTPTTTGTFNFTATVDDDYEETASQTYQVTINAAPAFGSIVMPQGVQGTAYSSSAVPSARSGGTPTFSWSIATGGLPPGLNLNSDGSIGGTPSASGSYTAGIRVTDLSGATAVATVQIVILSSGSSGPVTITTTEIPSGVVDIAYPAFSFAASGGTGTGYHFDVSDGSLPAGLSLSSSGVLSGTPHVTGSFNVAIRAVDSGNNSAVRSYTGLITSFTCPDNSAIVGQTYSSAATLGQFGAIVYSVVGGSLPTGLTLNSSNGYVTGTPTVEGLYTFTLRAGDVSSRTVNRSCSITTQSPIQLTSPRTTARVGVPYYSGVSAVGGTSGYSFSIVSGNLPNGLALNSSTGGIQGTPTTAGTSNFRVRAVDSASRTAERDFLIVSLTRTTTPSLRCPLPYTISNTPYRSALSVNLSGTLTYAITSGTLPPGFSLNAQTGLISGTTNMGTDTSSSSERTFTATVSGGLNGPISTSCTIFGGASATFLLNVACPDQNDLVAGEAYTSPAIASAGRRPYSYSLYQSSPPPGLSLNPETGMLSGTPFASGTYPYQIAVQDSSNIYYEVSPPPTTASCVANISNATPLNWVTTSLPTGSPNSSYSAPLVLSGGIAPYHYYLSGSLPAGLSLSSSTGVISGTPQSPGTTTFSVTAYDYMEQSATRSFSITIGTTDPLHFATSFVDGGTVGLSYSQSIQAAGGTPPYRFAVSSGSVTPGVSFSADGRLSGTPTTAGTYTFTVVLSDAAGGSVDARFSMPVFQGSFRLGCPNAAAEFGVPYLSAANVLGGRSPYLFSLSSGSLPAGLALDPASGSISGTPTALGASVFVFAVSDAGSAKTQTQCSIGVANGDLRILTAGPIAVTAGESYTGKVEAGGGKSPYSWTLLVAPNDSGFKLASDGSYSGVALTKGNFALSLQVKDATGATASRTILLAAGNSTLSLSCPATLTLPLGVTTRGSFPISGGLAPYTLALASGTLPTAFAFDATSTGAANFSAKPEEAGKFTGEFEATDRTGTSVKTSCIFEVTGQPFLISTTSLADGAVGGAYASTVATSGAVGFVRFGITSGSLPEGLSIDVLSGSIEGTPTKKGSFGFTVTATDDLKRKAPKALSIEIKDGNLPLTITTGSPLSDAIVGKAYSAGFGVEGGKAPYSWSIEGTPAGLNANGDSVSGTPTQAGDVSLSVSVSDAKGAKAQKSFLLHVKPAGSLDITTDAIPDGKVDEAYAAGLAAEGGSQPLFWTIVRGSIPSGVSFDPATGSFSGTPSVTGQFGVTVQVMDVTGATARKSYNLEVRPDGVKKLQITTESLPNGSAGVSYSSSIGATGGREPYRWSIDGDLPTGLSFSANGGISGTPSVIGTKSFVVTVTDSLGLRATKVLSLKVTTDSTPGVSVNGLPGTGGVNQNLPFTIQIASPFGVPVTGELTLSFVPDAIHGVDDPAVRFANGTRKMSFTIAAGSTQVTLADANASIATGTLAGTIRVDSVLNFAGVSSPGPSRTIVIARAAPVITAVRVTRSSGSLEIRVEGYSNTRQLSEARIAFSAAGSVDLTTATQVVVNVQAAIQAWFASAASQSFGGQFALTLPFTVSGNPADITGVSVVITNGEGASAAVAAN